MEIEEDIDEIETNNGQTVLPEKIKPKYQDNQTSINESENIEEEENDEKEHIDIDGEVVLTHTVERGMDTDYHTGEFKDEPTNISVNQNCIDRLLAQRSYIQNEFEKWAAVSFLYNHLFFNLSD